MKILLALIFLLSATCVAAQGNSTIYGVDNSSCAQYLREVPVSEQDSTHYNWWLTGFLSGSNVAKGRVTYTDNAAHIAWIRQYCEKNPLDSFIQAAIALDKELNKRTPGQR